MRLESGWACLIRCVQILIFLFSVLYSTVALASPGSSVPNHGNSVRGIGGDFLSLPHGTFLNYMSMHVVRHAMLESGFGDFGAPASAWVGLMATCASFLFLWRAAHFRTESVSIRLVQRLTGVCGSQVWHSAAMCSCGWRSVPCSFERFLMCGVAKMQLGLF